MAKRTVTAMREPNTIVGAWPGVAPTLSLVHKKDMRPTHMNIRDLEKTGILSHYQSIKSTRTHQHSQTAGRESITNGFHKIKPLV